MRIVILGTDTARTDGETARPPTDVSETAHRLTADLFFRELLPPVAITAAVAFALIPAGRAAAWIGLLVVTIGLGRIAGRVSGTTAAGAASLLYLWVHGHPRFATTVTDPSTIRLALLLGTLGALAGAAADWRRRSLHRR